MFNIVTDVQDDAAICAEILQTKQSEEVEIEEENSADTIDVALSKNKKVLHAFDTIRQHLQYEGADINTFFCLDNNIQN